MSNDQKRPSRRNYHPDLFDWIVERELRATNPAVRRIAQKFGLSIRHATFQANMRDMCCAPPSSFSAEKPANPSAIVHGSDRPNPLPACKNALAAASEALAWRDTTGLAAVREKGGSSNWTTGHCAV
jgi:hypothetical protein